MNNTNTYFSCFSLIRACVSSLFDNFFKVVAVCLIVCFVLISPAAAFASTTESMMMYASNDVQSVQPRGIYQDYSMSLAVASCNIDTNSGYSTVTPVTGNLFDITNGADSLILSNLSQSINSIDTLVGFYANLYNNNPYGKGVPSAYLQDVYIDMGIMRQFVQIDNVNYDIAIGAVPNMAYALTDVNYSYQYTNESGNLRTYEGSVILELPVEVVNDDFYSNGGHNTHIKVHGFDFDDVVAQSKTGYFNSLVTEDIERFTCWTSSLTIYVLYDLASFYNFSNDTALYLTSDTNALLFYGVHNINGVPNSFNFRVDPNTFNKNDFTFSLSNMTQAFTSMFTDMAGSMGNIVTNATDNANRIIQNTTQKVDEVKQGVTAVKDSVVETKNSILDLPNKIKDMLLGLIIPSDEDIAGKYDEFSTLLEAKLGVIYQIPAMILELFQTLLSGVTDPQTTLTFPSLSLPWIDGTQMKLWDSIEFEIIPTGMDVLKELIQTVTSMVCVIMTFNSVKRIYENFLRGR